MRLRSAPAAVILMILLLIGLVLILPLVGTAEQRQETARIQRIFGTVELKQAASASWLPANNRQTIRQGDTLRTGANSYVLVQLSDRNVVKLLSNTEFTFTSMRADESYSDDRVLVFFPATETSHHYDVQLEEGGAVSVLRGLEGNSTYDMRTPVAVAGVRGTVFLALVTHEDGRLSYLDDYTDGAKGQGGGMVSADFFCFEGALQMSGVGGQNMGMIPAGQGASFRGAAGGGGQGGGPSGGGPQPGGGGEGGGGGAPGVESQTFDSFESFASNLPGGGAGVGGITPGAVQDVINSSDPTTNTGDNPNSQAPVESGGGGGSANTFQCIP